MAKANLLGWSMDVKRNLKKGFNKTWVADVLGGSAVALLLYKIVPSFIPKVDGKTKAVIGGALTTLAGAAIGSKTAMSLGVGAPALQFVHSYTQDSLKAQGFRLYSLSDTETIASGILPETATVSGLHGRYGVAQGSTGVSFPNMNSGKPVSARLALAGSCPNCKSNSKPRLNGVRKPRLNGVRKTMGRLGATVHTSVPVQKTVQSATNGRLVDRNSI